MHYLIVTDTSQTKAGNALAARRIALTSGPADILSCGVQIARYVDGVRVEAARYEVCA